jgi:hypothetical protein
VSGLAQGSLDLLKELDKETAPPSQAADPFQVLDAAVAQAPEKEKGLADQLGKNLAGSLRVRGGYYFRDAAERQGADMKRGFGEGLLRFSDWTGGNLAGRYRRVGRVRHQMNPYSGVTYLSRTATGVAGSRRSTNCFSRSTSRSTASSLVNESFPAACPPSIPPRTA